MKRRSRRAANRRAANKRSYVYWLLVTGAGVNKRWI